MSAQTLHPLIGLYPAQLRHCKLEAHAGVARLGKHGDDHHPTKQMVRHFQKLAGKSIHDPCAVDYEATAIVPACGQVLILLRDPSEERLTREFGNDLTLCGEGADGPFRLRCPQYYVKLTSERDVKPFWAVAAPVNPPMTIEYGVPRPVTTIEAIINNFDFQDGNQHHDPESADFGSEKGLLVRSWRGPGSGDWPRLLDGIDNFRSGQASQHVSEGN